MGGLRLSALDLTRGLAGDELWEDDTDPDFSILDSARAMSDWQFSISFFLIVNSFWSLSILYLRFFRVYSISSEKCVGLKLSLSP